MTSSSERRGSGPGPGGSARDPATRSRLHDEIDALRGTPAPGAAPHAYARFIPREEVHSFAAWTPGSFGGATAGGAEPPVAAEPKPPAPQELGLQLQAARQGGYADGYRDGLVALEAFKQSYAQQVTAQVSGVAQAWRQQLDQIEQTLAAQVAEVAIALARQVVRGEIALRPEQVATVAQEALAATLVAAQQIAVHLHPDDHALVQAQVGEVIAARGARLVADPTLTRGGCVIESEVGVIDASVEARWQRATSSMGRPSDYQQTAVHEDGAA
jgi:flagellar assembly protein FliH